MNFYFNVITNKGNCFISLLIELENETKSVPSKVLVGIN